MVICAQRFSRKDGCVLSVCAMDETNERFVLSPLWYILCGVLEKSLYLMVFGKKMVENRQIRNEAFDSPC